MKLLIISDVHSNSECLRAIWEAEQTADAIYCAGDLTDYGPFPGEVIDWMKEHNVHCVAGNHDKNLLRLIGIGDYGDPEEGLGWGNINCRTMRPEHVDYLRSLPSWLEWEADGIHYLMGHQIEDGYEMPSCAYVFDRVWGLHAQNADSALPRCMIFGHSHRQMEVRLEDGLRWFNPGSASYRREDDNRKDAYYAVIENGILSLRHVAYDRSRLIGALERYRPVLTRGDYRVGDFFFQQTEEDRPPHYPDYF